MAVFRQKKSFPRMNQGTRINFPDPLFHHPGFHPPDRRFQSDNLTIQIRHADHIFINQRKFSDTAAGQRLHDITAHASDSKNRRMALGQPL